MKVLVVIPTVNRPKMCARALDSLLAQTFEDWNCVISKNGGSEAFGSYVCELGDRLNDSRVRLMTLPGRGLGYALNGALAPFLSGYNAWANLEDDDEWDPRFLEVMSRELKGADVVHCLQRQVPDRKQSNGGVMNPARLRTQNWINWPMCLWKKRTYTKVGPISEDCGPSTDWDWHLRCVQRGIRYKFVADTLVTHHWHGNNYCIKKRYHPIVPQRIRDGFYD